MKKSENINKYLDIVREQVVPIVVGVPWNNIQRPVNETEETKDPWNNRYHTDNS